MSSRSNRMERQIKNLEWGLMVGGVVMLALSMGMAGKFGYGLGHDEVGKWGSAVFYAGADFIGALFMAAVGVLFAWRWYAAGTFVMIATAGCIAFSMTTIFGFQSSNRTAVTRNYEAKKQSADKRLDWLRGLTIDKNLTKDRTAMLNEEREQYNKMQEADPDPDEQASELAEVLGIKKTEAQRRLNMMASAFILFLQFTCLSLRSFLRHRVAPAITALNHGPRGSDNSGHFQDSVKKVSKAEARLDVQRVIGEKRELCNSEFAARWGVSESDASKWQSEFQREGVMRRVQRGRRKVAVAPTQKLHVVS